MPYAPKKHGELDLELLQKWLKKFEHEVFKIFNIVDLVNYVESNTYTSWHVANPLTPKKYEPGVFNIRVTISR